MSTDLKQHGVGYLRSFHLSLFVRVEDKYDYSRYHLASSKNEELNVAVQWRFVRDRCSASLTAVPPDKFQDRHLKLSTAAFSPIIHN
jgi:hypothetical protein